VQSIGPARSKFRYRAQEFEPSRRIRLRSRGRLVDATDIMTFAVTREGSALHIID